LLWCRRNEKRSFSNIYPERLCICRRYRRAQYAIIR
jgi:hypothetical protein